MSNQIRAYTPQAARDYSRAIDSVYAKISRTFASLQEPQTPAAQEYEQHTRATLQEAVHHFAQTKWDYSRCADNGAPMTPMNSEQQRELKATVESIMLKFMDGFRLNAKIRKTFNNDTTTCKAEVFAHERHINASAGGKELPARTMYRRETAALDLVDILANHVTNESLSRLKSSGLDDVQSYKACGFLIHESMIIFRNEMNMKSGGVRPVRGIGVCDEDNISRVVDFWRRKQEQLEALHFNDSLRASYRA